MSGNVQKTLHNNICGISTTDIIFCKEDKMRQNKIAFYLKLISLASPILLSACGKKQEIPPPTETVSIVADDLVTELCVCQSVNADGSLLLWGDREENNKFSAYSVDNTIGAERGSEVAITYSESARKKARTVQYPTYTLYLLQADEINLSNITLALATQAVDGSRKEKYLKEFGTPKEEEVQEQEDQTPVNVEGAVDQKEKTPEIITGRLTMDNTNITPDGVKLDVELTYGNQIILRAEYSKLSLNANKDYVFACTAYDLSKDSYMGTILNPPSIGSILVYLNESNQIRFGVINSSSAMPDDMYLINFTPIALTDIK